MTEERDADVSAAYRGLGAEEPPRALDDAILAAARRSTSSWSKRWAMPLSLAAVVVLSVTVTLRIQHEQPEIAGPAPAAKQEAKSQVQARAEAAKVSAAEAAKPMVAKSTEISRPSLPKPFPAKEEGVVAERRIPAAPQAAESAPASVPSAGLSSRADDARVPQAGPTPMLAKRSAAQGNLQIETPERELERIAELRRQGRQDEADRALAEFRKRYPDYRIPEEMRLRVERR
ncbi:MAG: hypothetical protein EXR33_00745 [Betaproteobacteria bacterium]|nr:hypothetical protein [Betaproteobacteria bacterium]